MCEACHEQPDESLHVFKMEEDQSATCLTCHDSVAGPVEHKPVTEGHCTACHEPHHSAFPALLNESPKDVCMSCHDAAIKVDEDTTVSAVGPLLSMEFTHGPIQEGNCSACHDPHGSDVFSILRDPYPRKFYSKWNPEMYTLCFRCHEESIFTDEKTETLTEFRNGETNLHYMHVNRAKKGRTCRACHEVHASSYPVHLADVVPVGGWGLPRHFEVTPHGGCCSPGCQHPMAYDREEAVQPVPKVPVEPVVVVPEESETSETSETSEIPEIPEIPETSADEPSSEPAESPPAEKPEE